jgi:protein-tyrosine-phosphatase
MAEGFARHLAHNGIEIYSAGTLPKEIHPLAVRVMNEAGTTSPTAQRDRGDSSTDSDHACGEADETCPPEAKATSTLASIQLARDEA